MLLRVAEQDDCTRRCRGPPLVRPPPVLVVATDNLVKPERLPKRRGFAKLHLKPLYLWARAPRGPRKGKRIWQRSATARPMHLVERQRKRPPRAARPPSLYHPYAQRYEETGSVCAHWVCSRPRRRSQKRGVEGRVHASGPQATQPWPWPATSPSPRARAVSTARVLYPDEPCRDTLLLWCCVSTPAPPGAAREAKLLAACTAPRTRVSSPLLSSLRLRVRLRIPAILAVRTCWLQPLFSAGSD